MRDSFKRVAFFVLALTAFGATISAPYRLTLSPGKQVSFEEAKSLFATPTLDSRAMAPVAKVPDLHVVNLTDSQVFPLDKLASVFELSEGSPRGPPGYVYSNLAHASYDFEGQAGSGDYVSITDDAQLNIPDDEFAFIFWIKRGGVSTDTSTWTSEYVLSNGGFNDANSIHIWIAHGATADTSTLNFKLTGTGGQIYNSNTEPSGTTTLNSTSWICLIVQREADTTIKGYVNGTQVLSDTKEQAYSTLDMASGMIIGGRGDLNVNRYFDGLIAEFGFRSGSSFDSSERTDLCTTPVRLTSYTTDVVWYHDMQNDLNADIGTLSWSTSNASQDADHPSFSASSSSGGLREPHFGISSFDF